jgi:hypothetical protein
MISYSQLAISSYTLHVQTILATLSSSTTKDALSCRGNSGGLLILFVHGVYNLILLTVNKKS